MTEVQNGVAVITGAAGGLGRALAEVAARRGMKLVLADMAADRLQDVAADLRSGGAEVETLATDVSDPAALERLAEHAFATFGEVTLLINNAGIATVGLSWELSSETWARMVGVNFMGVVNGCHAFVPRILAAGTKAHVVNIASVAALGIMPLVAPYIATKQAVLAFSECLKLEMDLKQAPIAVSVVLPAAISTPIFDSAIGLGTDPLAQGHLAIMLESLREQGTSPEEVAEIIFNQIDEGRFWISPHGEVMEQMAKQRGAYLSHLQTPELTELHRQLLPHS